MSVIDDDVTYNEEIKITVSDTMTIEPFAGLPISDPTQTALKDMGFHHMTHIQAASIPPLLQGKHVLATYSTCFGQSLAFLIPAVELLYRARLTPSNGTHAIVLCPSMDSAVHTHALANRLLKYHPLITLGRLVNRETDLITKGVNILVSTPSRLLDHLQNTKGFTYEDLKYLVIYESHETISEAEFEEIRQIIGILPSARQTSFFSFARNDKAENLARLLFTTTSTMSQRVYIDIRVANGGPEQHGYCVVDRAERLVVLYSFLTRSMVKKKVMVVFSSCNSVQFHAELLRHLHVDCVDIHGRQDRETRGSRLSDFSKMDKGILLCTETEAHRSCAGINADWIVQYDPPEVAKEYVRGVECMKGGKVLIFLTPEELGFVDYLKKALKGSVKVWEFDRARIADVGPQLEALVSDNYDLSKAARDAYRCFVMAYNSNCMKEVFNVHNIDLRALQASFCFTS